jgi:hypothetical protein
MKYFYTVLALVFLSACSTTNKQVSLSQDVAKSVSLIETQDAKADADNIEKALRETLEFCAPILQGYEDKTESQAKRAYWLSISGLVAGSVLAPALVAGNAAANASSVAALSGWAGATNFASESLKSSGLSGTATAETRKGIIKNLTSAIEIATDNTKTFLERKTSILKARASCVIYDIAIPAIQSSE